MNNGQREDSAFHAYADWALAQEIAWDEEQEELEQLPKGWTHWEPSNTTEELS
jgi:hypothetical protein